MRLNCVAVKPLLIRVVVAISAVLLLVPAFAADGGFGMTHLAADNIVLLYDIPGNPVSPANFMPYVAYVDANNDPKAWFFDGFLYTTQGAYHGNADWAEALFKPNGAMPSLDKAVADAAKFLGEPPGPRQVYLAVPTMSGSADQRLERNRRFIDTTRALWVAGNFEHLQLAGYYWTHEGIRDPLARTTVEWTYSYIKGLQGNVPGEQQVLDLLFIPYDFGHPNRPQVNEFGQGQLPVDALWLQPNYLWADREKGYDRQDLDDVARFALSQNASVEMEFDSGVFLAGWKTSRYYHYLDSGVTYGYMNGPLAYYQSLWSYAEAANNPQSLMRQIYEDTFAFTQQQYRPRAVIYETPLPYPTSPAADLAVRFTNLGDALLGQGLWLGRRQQPEAVTELRWIEPDPNQAQSVIVSFVPPVGTDGEQGIVSLQTLDGSAVELGRFTLDGKAVTRWFNVPADVLSQGAPANPTNKRLTYTIRFSQPVEIVGAWTRTQQHVFEWERTTASLWAGVDTASYNSRQGLSLPGVRWDDSKRRVQWFGMDTEQGLLIGVETHARSFTHRVSSASVDSSGAGFWTPKLADDEQVVRVWAWPETMPFYVSFGAAGDTAAAVRSPGISLMPQAGWQFVGMPVGFVRRLVGRADMQVVVPDDGRSYMLHVAMKDVNRVSWELTGADPDTDTTTGTDTATRTGAVTDEHAEIKLPHAGQFTIAWTGVGSFVEAWLVAIP